jgi:hypothetical protein
VLRARWVITADGSLIAATVSATYPAPPGSSRLLRWSAAQLTRALAGGALLTVADAVVVGPPFDGAYDLAHDDRGQVYVSDGLRGQVWQVDLASGARARLPLLATGGAGTTHLAWRRGSGPATFAPYQPAGGGELLAVVADWASVQSEAVAITAQRPGLTVQPGNPVPHGAAAVLAEGLAPNAPSVLFVSPLPAQPERGAALRHGHAALAGPRRAHRAVGLAGQRRRPGPRELVVLAPRRQRHADAASAHAAGGRHRQQRPAAADPTVTPLR